MVTHYQDSSPRSPEPVEIDVPDSITYPNNTPFVGWGARDPTRLQEERYQKTRVQKRSDDMVTSRTRNCYGFNNNQQNHRHMYDTLMSTRIVTLTMTKLYWYDTINEKTEESGLRPRFGWPNERTNDLTSPRTNLSTCFMYILRRRSGRHWREGMDVSTCYGPL